MEAWETRSYLQSLQHDKARFVSHNGAPPAAAHLGDAVDAPDQDAEVGAQDGVEEQAGPPVAPEGEGAGGQDVFLATLERAAHPHQVVRGHGAEAEQDGDLEGDADDDDAVAGEQQGGVVGLGRGGEAAADGLQDQARDVGGDEDERVQPRPDARERRRKRQHRVLERQVDGDAQQRRRQHDAADLQLEAVLAERVRVELQPAYVACDTGETPLVSFVFVTTDYIE